MEESPSGHKIANANTGNKVKLAEYSEPEIVNCDIKSFRFPSHALREELIEIVKKLNPEKIILVHGDPSAIDWVGANIIKKYKHIMVYSAEPGKELLL